MKIFVLNGDYENATVLAESEEQAREIINNSIYTHRDINNWNLNRVIDIGDTDTKPQLLSNYFE